MKMFLFRPLATFLLLFHGVVQPASLSDGGSNNRIFQGEKLSEKEHVDQENFDYDHEAFLGADEAHEFDDLDPEESKRRLGVIVDKIDEDADGLVTMDEMRKWIRFTQDRYMTQDVERQWIQHNQDGKDEIGWEEYRKLVYGFVDDGKEMEDREERRWKMADEDGNGVLSKLEFKHFLHPEEVERMRDVVVQETMEDMDKDGDGQLSEGEYIGDMYQGEEGAEPDWVWRERESFNELRDQDGDGYMNEQEVRDWIFPSNFDHVEAEARHLMAESDADGDGKLTKEEILDKSDLFVGSQVTNFGEALTRHDEF